jgi:RHS repeat-associated protein
MRELGGGSHGASGADRDYDYDKNGNLVADRNKGITRIVYNYMNLPQTIEFTGNRKIEFVYDATGMKLRKTVIEPNVPNIVTDYMDGFEYKNNTIERIHHAEGVITQRAKRDGESTEFVGAGGLVWQYEYTLKDHLGNTRVTFADIDGSRTIQPNAEINQINHYYPFGLNMEGNWNGAAGSNKYQLTGKEWNDDFGLGMNDFGARMYDPAIGRWNAVDKICESYNRYSPYNYTMDNPIKFIDPDGSIVTDPDGHIIVTYDGTQNNNGGSLVRTENSNGTYTLTDLSFKGDNVKIYANDGTPIKALVVKEIKVVSEKTYDKDNKQVETISANTDCNTNCHGTTFSNGKLWIDNYAVQSLLTHDGYTKTVKDAKGKDVKVKQSDSDISISVDGSGIVVHSIRQNSEGYTSDDGCNTTKTKQTYNAAMGGYGANVTAHLCNPQGGVNKAMKTTLGEVDKAGNRKITKKDEIQKFVESLNHNMVAQPYFKVYSKLVEKDSFFKIELITMKVESDTMDYPTFWNKSIHFPSIDTNKVIEELLLYEGDERLCLIPIRNYSMEGCNPNYYWGEENRYSLQIEALFIMNQIIFKEPCRFFYMSSPVLKDIKTEEIASVKGDIIKRAYASYKKWFELAKLEGVSKIIERHIYPLDDSDIRWY